MRNIVLFIFAVTFVSACVRQEDLDSWQGVPVRALDAHPFFITLPVDVRRLDDGTEIRNYVNGRNIGSCTSNASVNAYGQYSLGVTGTSSCSSRFGACNNIFYIKNGIVQRYAPTGSGGARCFTDSRVTPKPY